MYWWVNLFALLFMIAILEVDPANLYSLSQLSNSSEWLFVGYLSMATSLIIWIVKTWVTSFIKNKSVSLFVLGVNQPPIKNFTKILLPLLTLLFITSFFVAIFSNTIAQRLYQLEHSVNQVRYVTAIVQPIGLSDRQFELSKSPSYQTQKTTQHNTNKPKVMQNYRLLANLTNIEPLTAIDATPDKASSTINNPFNKPFYTTTTSNNHYKEHSIAKNMTVLINSFDPKQAWLNELQPNQKIPMRLALRPLKIPTDPQAFNEFRWLSSRHATATATIIDTNPINVSVAQSSFRQNLEVHRYHLRQHLYDLWVNKQPLTLVLANTTIDNNLKSTKPIQNDSQAMAVTLSLLTGDRSFIDKDTTALYRFAGISHLLAISGTHVLFLAILAAWLAGQLINLIIPSMYRHISRWQIQLTIAVVIAFIYALFAGFDVPAARTAWMLLLVGIIRFLLLARATFKVLLGLAIFMAWQDVFVLWQAGFWLSFIAVTVLVAYTYQLKHSMAISAYNKGAYNDARTQASKSISKTKAKSSVADEGTTKRLAFKIYNALRYFILLQIWMTLALLPISLWLFGKVSLWGLFINLFAIGFFGWLVVPLNLLAGLLFFFAPSLADMIWSGLFALMTVFHNFLIYFNTATNQTGWLYTSITLPMLAAVVLMILPWLLPKKVLSRLFSLPASLLLILLTLQQTNAAKVDASLLIKSLNTKDKTLSASLLISPTDNWLLLSAYPQQNKPFSYLTDKQQLQFANKLAVQLYDELMSHKINSLTGVIVQTPTAMLADSVNILKDKLSIHHYWQAGSFHFNPPSPNDSNPLSDSSLSNHSMATLTAKPCGVGQRWDNNTSDPYKTLSIIAVTGWQSIDNKAVWSCAIKVSSRYQIKLDGNMLSPIAKIPIESDATINEIIFNSSQDSQLWKLWQLMCSPSNLLEDTSLLRGQYWLTPEYAHLNINLVHQVSPLSLHILNNDQQDILPHQSDAVLYWNQVIKNIK